MTKKATKKKYEKPMIRSIKAENIAANVGKGGKFPLRSFVG